MAQAIVEGRHFSKQLDGIPAIAIDDATKLAKAHLALAAERDALREAAQALVTARAEGARIEPWGALVAALERPE